MTEDIKELLVLYALGELEGEEQNQAEELARQPEYSQWVNQIQQTDSLLRTDFQSCLLPIEDHPALNSKPGLTFQQKPESALSGDSSPLPSFRRQRPSRILYWTAATAILLLISILTLVFPTSYFLDSPWQVAFQPKNIDSTQRDLNAYSRPASLDGETTDAGAAPQSDPPFSQKNVTLQSLKADVIHFSHQDAQVDGSTADPSDQLREGSPTLKAKKTTSSLENTGAAIIDQDDFYAEQAQTASVAPDADAQIESQVMPDAAADYEGKVMYAIPNYSLAPPSIQSNDYSGELDPSGQEIGERKESAAKQTNQNESVDGQVHSYFSLSLQADRLEEDPESLLADFYISDNQNGFSRENMAKAASRRRAAVEAIRKYAPLWKENSFVDPKSQPFSTFGVDVDTASYTIMRSMINNCNQLPEPTSVRVEEYINYFDYELPEPGKAPGKEPDCPFAAHVEIGRHPTAEGLLLAKIGIQGRKTTFDNLPPLNLVFLLDVSGSMASDNKLPWVKESMKKLAEQLRPQDFAAIVTYAGEAKIFLEPINGSNKQMILDQIDSLEANGSTNGSGGIELAYELGRRHFDPKSINRVILCSDGDFNVGITAYETLEKQITEAAKSGIFLSVLGYGMDNYRDERMESLADKGNGNYAYIDSLEEAQHVLGDKLPATIAMIAKDVKLQIDFNPQNVQSYRLIGYENRAMAAEDFNNDRKDSGDIGPGHQVVALYEIVPVGQKNPFEPGTDSSRYAQKEAGADKNEAPKKEPSKLDKELFLVKIRYKQPNETTSVYKDFPVPVPTESQLNDVSPDWQFCAAVALTAQILRSSKYSNVNDWKTVDTLLENADANNPQRREFKELVKKMRALSTPPYIIEE